MASKLSEVVSIIDLVSKDEKAPALSSLLQVPLIKVDAIEDDIPNAFVMSIRPSYRVLSQALFDLMDFFAFSRVAVVYDGIKLNFVVKRLHVSSHKAAVPSTDGRWVERGG